MVVADVEPTLTEAEQSDLDKARAAQQERAKQYHIAPKDGGNITKPGEWAGLPDDSWADPVNYSYPMADKPHADNAAARWGDDSNRSQYSSAEQKIIGDRIAARQKHFGEKPATESLTTEAAFQPKPRIAQLKVRFLQNNAISRNGRQYPPEAVAALVRSGQQAVTDPAGPIVNACISHEAADNAENNPLVTTGKATRVWQEGADAFALFDIPDTTTGRDMCALIAGGYIPPTMSLRASGAVMKTERGKDITQVGGNLQLEGIDFTSRPGLEIARIQGLTFESTDIPQSISDEFDVSEAALVLETEEEGQASMTTKVATTETNGTAAPVTAPATPPVTTQPIREEANTILAPLVTGESPSTDGSPGSAYANAVYPKVSASIPPVDYFGQPDRESSRFTHDHVAAALGMACAPKTTEAGRKFNKMAEAHLVAVHDHHAKNLGLQCEGSYQQMAALKDNPQPDSNDDDDAMEQAKPAPQAPAVAKENVQSMTEQEALALLQQRGYTGITKPKTELELIQERFDAQLEAQRVQFEEKQKQFVESLKTQFAPQPAAVPAQRTTLVESAHTARAEDTGLPASPRARRTRIQEALMEANWGKLADKSEPLPDGVTYKDLLTHFGRLMVINYDQTYGSQQIKPRNV